MISSCYFVRLIATFVVVVIEASALTTPRNPASPWDSRFNKLLPPPNEPAAKRRSYLKQQLCQECSDNFGNSNSEIRENIQNIIDELVPLNPTEDTATSPMLMKEWNL